MADFLQASSLVEAGVPAELAGALVRQLQQELLHTPAELVWTGLIQQHGPDVPFAAWQLLHDAVYMDWDPDNGPPPAWAPSDEFIETTNIHRLMREQNSLDYNDLYAWSVRDREEFWDAMIVTLGIRFQRPASTLLDETSGAEHPNWLEGAELNIMESCFQADPESPAVLHGSPDGNITSVTYEQLRTQVNRVSNGLVNAGFKAGDAVAIAMPMTLESVTIYLGLIQAGMTAVSIADSMAAAEIATRIQIANAKGIFTQDVLVRGGKTLPMLEKVIQANAPRAIVLPGAKDRVQGDLLRDIDRSWATFLSDDASFEPVMLPPMAPINILFSSGTTGDPKAIPWNQTTPIKAAADGHLHHNIQSGHVVAWPTNLGWMMGPWLIFATLINKATMALYSDTPTTKHFCRFVQDANVNMLGLVPSVVKAWRANGAMEGVDWNALQCFSSTGECSNAEDYLYLMVMSGGKPMIEYCGGTELGGGYITGSLVQPAVPAAFSTPTLGTSFVILDEAGMKADNGEVFLVPPSLGMSLDLLNRDHHEAYFSDAPAGPGGEVLRRHGDQLERLGNGYFRAHGRVDDTMNLGGIKVSSAEIERVLDPLPGVSRTAAVAVNPDGGGPSQLVIFAIAETVGTGAATPDDLKKQMQQAIKEHLNPLFRIHEVRMIDQLPVTASNKVMRRALRARIFADAKNS